MIDGVLLRPSGDRRMFVQGVSRRLAAHRAVGGPVLLKQFSHEGLAQASDRMEHQHNGEAVALDAMRDADSFMMGTLPFQAEWVPRTDHVEAAAV